MLGKKLFRKSTGPNRRKHKRYNVIDGAYVIIEQYRGVAEKIQLLDIGEGGLAFVYAFMGDAIAENGQISIIAGDKIYLEKVLYETMSDEELSQVSNEMIVMRRRGVQFKKLKGVDKDRLMDFITENMVH